MKFLVENKEAILIILAIVTAITGILWKVAIPIWKDKKEKKSQDAKPTNQQFVDISFLQTWTDNLEKNVMNFLKVFEEKSKAVNELSIKKGFEDAEEDAFPGLRKKLEKLSSNQVALEKSMNDHTAEIAKVSVSLKDIRFYQEKTEHRVCSLENDNVDLKGRSKNLHRRLKAVEIAA